jgi:hypothetical protein
MFACERNAITQSGIQLAAEITAQHTPRAGSHDMTRLLNADAPHCIASLDDPHSGACDIATKG